MYLRADKFAGDKELLFGNFNLEGKPVADVDANVLEFLRNHNGETLLGRSLLNVDGDHLPPVPCPPELFINGAGYPPDRAPHAVAAGDIVANVEFTDGSEGIVRTEKA